MNLWIIGAIVAGLLVLGVVAVNAFDLGNLTSATTSSTSGKSCSSCGNSCTKESNCGLQTCGAVSGKTCGCRK